MWKDGAEAPVRRLGFHYGKTGILIVSYVKGETMEWQELSKIEESLWGKDIEVLCIDGRVVRGAYWCHNAADTDEDEGIEIDIKQKAFFVGVPISKIVPITVLD